MYSSHNYVCLSVGSLLLTIQVLVCHRDLVVGTHGLFSWPHPVCEYHQLDTLKISICSIQNQFVRKKHPLDVGKSVFIKISIFVLNERGSPEM